MVARHPHCAAFHCYAWVLSGLIVGGKLQGQRAVGLSPMLALPLQLLNCSHLGGRQQGKPAAGGGLAAGVQQGAQPARGSTMLSAAVAQQQAKGCVCGSVQPV